jgi:very-short-patch-repair endonuclease
MSPSPPNPLSHPLPPPGEGGEEGKSGKTETTGRRFHAEGWFGVVRATRRSREARAPEAQQARELRAEQTPAEEVLWERLRGRRFLGLKFRRQFPVEGFIADFYCHDVKLIVEVDGPVHCEPQQAAHDENRDIVLRSLGLKLLRVTNSEVFQDLDAVLRQIAKAAGLANRSPI